MHPVIFKFGPIVVRWYGVMMALTILTSIGFAGRWAPRFGIDRTLFDRLTFWLVIVLLAGARLGYVVSHPAEFRDPVEIIRVWHGGLSSHGAVAAGLLYAYLLARRTGISLWSLADTGAWVVPLTGIFVRFGNFMNGELYGDPTTLPSGVRFPTMPDAPRHPLQIYEMVASGLILLVTWQVARRRAFPGQVWWVAIGLSSVVRIALDALRSDDHVILGIIAYGQVAAAILLAFSIWFLWSRSRTRDTRR